MCGIESCSRKYLSFSIGGRKSRENAKPPECMFVGKYGVVGTLAVQNVILNTNI